jgi:hypothetical protein
MSNTTTRSNNNHFADQLVNVGVPLVIIAMLAERIGAPIGSLSTILAAALAAAVATIVRHFGARALMRAAGTKSEDGRFYALLGGVNAAIAALSVAAISMTMGF